MNWRVRFFFKQGQGAVALLLMAALAFSSCSNENKTSPGAMIADIPAEPPLPKHVLIQFPRDEGVHSEFPIEWWYLNAQFTNTAGKKFAFFYTKFSSGRHLVSLFDKESGRYMAKDFYEQVTADKAKLSVSSITGKWEQMAAPFQYLFSYNYEGVGVELALKAKKKPFLPHEDGFVAMGETGTSYYYSFTDMDLVGKLKMGTNEVEIGGKAWMDHQWGAWDWMKDFSQWKWYSIKLDSGIDVMLFNFYKDGKLLHSYCGYMDAAGLQYHKLANNLVTKSALVDPRGGKWQREVDIEIPSLQNTKLTLTSESDSQFVEQGVLWEGSMKVKGTFKGKEVSGTAFQELNRPD